jgi:hypothetical protein
MKFFFSSTKNGWQTSRTFLDYVEVVIQEMRDKGVTGPIVIFADGFPGHLCLDLQRFCNAKDVIFILLLPNSTHLLQPLDVVIFRPLKAEYKNQLLAYKQKHKKTEIKEADFVHVLAKSLKEVISKELVQKSFEVTGLFPLNSTAIRPDRLLLQPESSQEILTETQQNTQLSAPQGHSDIQNHFKKLEDQIKLLSSQITSMNAATCSQVDLPSQNLEQAIVTDETPPQSSSGKATIISNILLTPATPPIDFVDTENIPVRSYSDILTFPKAPEPKKRQTKFKLPKSGIMSNFDVITAVEEAKEAKKMDEERKLNEKRERLKRRQDKEEENRVKAQQKIEAKKIKLEEETEKKMQKIREREQKIIEKAAKSNKSSKSAKSKKSLKAPKKSTKN